MTGKVEGKKKALRRTIAHARKQPWGEFVNLEPNEEMQKAGVVAALENARFRVFVKIARSKMFVGADGVPSPISHLIIVKKDGSQPTWNELQRVKSDVCHPFADGIELYPSEMRRLNVPQRHLFVFEPGFVFPIGLSPAHDVAAQLGSALEKLIDATPLFVVRLSNAEYEVYVDESEFNAAYEGKEDKPTDTKVLPFDRAPHESSTVRWSEKAKEVRAALMKAMESMATEKLQEKPADPVISEKKEEAPVDPEVEEAAAIDLAKMREEMVARKKRPGQIGFEKLLARLNVDKLPEWCGLTPEMFEETYVAHGDLAVESFASQVERELEMRKFIADGMTPEEARVAVYGKMITAPISIQGGAKGLEDALKATDDPE